MKKRFLYILLLLFILSIILFKGIAVDYIGGLNNTLEKDDIIVDIDEIDEDIIVEPTTTDISILAVGDIMFHMPQIKAASISEGVLCLYGYGQ